MTAEHGSPAPQQTWGHTGFTKAHSLFFGRGSAGSGRAPGADLRRGVAPLRSGEDDLEARGRHWRVECGVCVWGGVPW